MISNKCKKEQNQTNAFLEGEAYQFSCFPGSDPVERNLRNPGKSILVYQIMPFEDIGDEGIKSPHPDTISIFMHIKEESG